LKAQIGVSHASLIKVAQLMEENIERPLSLDAIAGATGLSRRQIERLFKRHLHCVPKRYYLDMRLRRARDLLLQTAMPVMDITTACGFQSPPHFSKCYRNHYGYPPSAERHIRLQAVRRRSRARRWAHLAARVAACGAPQWSAKVRTALMYVQI
jgi:transcriptional regulator GlxA family with amidase domain